jgi:exopolyphosphatase/pppGpp-phosphohydrolase
MMTKIIICVGGTWREGKHAYEKKASYRVKSVHQYKFEDADVFYLAKIAAVLIEWLY